MRHHRVVQIDLAALPDDPAVLQRMLQEVVPELQAENEQKAIHISLLEQENDHLRDAFNETQTTVPALYAEVHRLQGLLDIIYASRTWKLHNIVQKVKGVG